VCVSCCKFFDWCVESGARGGVGVGVLLGGGGGGGVQTACR